MFKNGICHIANCTEEATHGVAGHPDDGFVVLPAQCYADYCFNHAEDVALAFAAYSVQEREAAMDRINGRAS